MWGGGEPWLGRQSWKLGRAGGWSRARGWASVLARRLMGLPRGSFSLASAHPQALNSLCK